MHAIVSLLDPWSYQRVEDLWLKLADACGLEGSKITPYPHLSWHIADDYQITKLAKRLSAIASRATPLVVACSGLGLFAGQEPVLFINIAKGEGLVRFQKRIWQRSQDVSIKPNPYYHPEAWIPHVTLAHRGLNPQSLACALEDLAFEPIRWEIKLENLALVCQEGDDVGQLKERWDFPSQANEEK